MSNKRRRKVHAHIHRRNFADGGADLMYDTKGVRGVMEGQLAKVNLEACIKLPCAPLRNNFFSESTKGV